MEDWVSFFCLQDLTSFQSLSSFLLAVLESLPPARYKETISALLAWLQQCEAKLSIPSTAVTEYPIMEQRLKDLQVLCTHQDNMRKKNQRSSAFRCSHFSNG